MALDAGNEQPGHRADDRGAPSPRGGWTVGLPARRRSALREVVAELGPAHRHTGQPGVALRDYGVGCLCVGIAGPVDRDGAARLQVLLSGLRVRGRHELVLSLAGVGPCHPQLARVLAHTRIQYLVAGAHVELHDLPDDVTGLQHSGSTTFLVVDALPARGAVPPPRSSGATVTARCQAPRSTAAAARPGPR